MQTPTQKTEEQVSQHVEKYGIDNMTKYYIMDGVKVINELGLWDWLREFEPEPNRGFMFSDDETLMKINKKLSKDHSGCSYGITMRNLHRLSRDTHLEKVKN